MSEVVCWKCERTGHYRTSCPEASEEELQKWSEFYRKKHAEKEKAGEPKADSLGTGGQKGSSGDGMTVDLLRTSERSSTRSKEGLATQDRRLGDPGKKWPGKGTKPNRGGAERPLLGGGHDFYSVWLRPTREARLPKCRHFCSGYHKTGRHIWECSPALCTHVPTADHRAAVQVRCGGDSVPMLGRGCRNCGSTSGAGTVGWSSRVSHDRRSRRGNVGSVHRHRGHLQPPGENHI
jgi:hypothetical protein